jgi:hypothetical protein
VLVGGVKNRINIPELWVFLAFLAAAFVSTMAIIAAPFIIY